MTSYEVVSMDIRKFLALLLAVSLLMLPACSGEEEEPAVAETEEIGFNLTVNSLY